MKSIMTPRECAGAWKEVVQIYHDTISNNNPCLTMEIIIKKLGLDKTKEVFATISEIKKHDGRIYGKNRDYIKGISINAESVLYERGNPMIYAGLDDIHTAHINNLITELRKIESKIMP